MDPHQELAVRYGRVVLARVRAIEAESGAPKVLPQVLIDARECLQKLLPDPCSKPSGTVDTEGDWDPTVDEGRIWDGIHAIELLLLSIDSLPEIKERIPLLLQEHKQLVGDAAHKEFLAQLPDLKSLKDGEALEWYRSRAKSLAEEVAYQYRALWCREGLRDHHRKRLFWTGCILAGLLSVVGMLVWMSPEWPPFPWNWARLIALISFAGALGAVTSVMRRQETLAWTGNADLELMFVEMDKSSTRSRVALGAVFAVVLFAIFLGGLMKGTLFPEFSDGKGLAAWNGVTRPELIDGAKLLVWSFLAGWAERLVPSQLDRLAEKASKS